MTYTYNLFEDNAGGLHLAVLDNSGACVYYLTDNHHEIVMDALAELKAGGDPIADGWEGGEPDPESCYNEINNFCDLRNGSAWEIEG